MRVARATRHIRVNIYYSPEARSFWANSPDLNGLAAAGKTRAEVEQEAMSAAETLFDLAGIHAKPELTFQDAEFQEE